MIPDARACSRHPAVRHQPDTLTERRCPGELADRIRRRYVNPTALPTVSLLRRVPSRLAAPTAALEPAWKSTTSWKCRHRFSMASCRVQDEFMRMTPEWPGGVFPG